MRITNIKLVNVSSIQTGLGTNELEVDLSESRNRVVLIDGQNGCGKTSLLSCLHPFAYNGSLDERSTESLIIPRKEGYKEVHIMNGADEYVIKHFYSPNGETHSVKSYISKNGTELNPNGNVGSFKELVSLELDLEQDFLKLIRLGANVTNFIPMKPTERKNFMGSLLDDVDIYLQYSKKVVADIRVMKTMIQTDADKIRKLGIVNIDEEKRQLDKTVDSLLPELKEAMNRERDKFTICEHQLSELPNYGDEIRRAPLVKDELKNIESKLHSVDNKFKKINEDPKNIEARCTELTSKIDANDTILRVLINDNNSLSNELDDLRIKRDKLANDEERASLKQIINTLEREIEHGDKEYRNFHPGYTAEELSDVYSLLEKWQAILSTTYEMGDKPIKKVIKLMGEMADIPAYIEGRMNALYANKMKSSGSEILEHLKRKVKRINALEKIDCSRECPYREIYTEILDISGAKEDLNVETDSFYSYMNTAYGNIKVVLDEIVANGQLLSRMPPRIQDMLTIKSLYTHISKLEWIYDKQILNEELSMVTEYELYLSKKDKLKDAKKDLDRLSDNSGLSFVIERIEEVNAKIEATSNDIDKLSKENSAMMSELESYEKLTETVELHSELVDRYAKLEEEYKTIQNNLETITEISRRREKHLSAYNELSERIIDVENATQKLRSKIEEYQRLTDELHSLKEAYDEWELMRSTLSSKEGIPLIHIDLYLKKTRKIVNELLDMVYGGDLRIQNFDISADTFKIPYEKNGKVISDARFASQGETSFMSIALSFALSLQSIKNYNIMLLDEIDSTLDRENRGKFIEILEHMMDMANIEQIFLISHNNMFDMYPVDLIHMEKAKKESTVLKALSAH